MKVSDREILPDIRSLLDRIAVVRRKKTAVAVSTGVTMAIGAVVAILAAEMLLDWLVEMPWLARLVVLLAALGAAGFIAWKHIIEPLRHRPDDDAAALMIEKALPIFRSRYIASVQLARAKELGSPVLVRALLAETNALAATLNFHKVVKTDRLRHVVKITAAVLAVVVTLCILAGHATLPLFARALLFNAALPRKTQILNTTGSRTLGVGDDLTIEATAAGVIPSRGKVFVKPAKGAAREFPLDPDPANAKHFTRLIQNVQESFDYTIRLNDNTSRTFHVTALPRPAVVKIECEQTFPAYTKLGTVHRAPGDLSLLAGSRLALRVRASTNLKSAAIHQFPSGADVPLKISAQDAKDLSGDLPIAAADLRGFAIHLVEEHGVESKDTATYRVDVIPDRAPTVRIVYPERREELLTQKGTLLIAFEAADDFGIARAILHYVVNKDSGGLEKSVELDLGGQTPKTLTRRYDWKIGALQPPPAEGNIIEYWLEVRDTNDVTGPGIGVSDHYQAKIVSDIEKRADLAARLGDTLAGLNEITADEEQLNQTLGTVIYAKPGQ
jgi:uncharacterized protein DUF4175